MIRGIVLAVSFFLLLGGLSWYATANHMVVLHFASKGIAILTGGSLLLFGIIQWFFGRKTAVIFFKNGLVLCLTFLIMLPVFEGATRYIFRNVTSTRDNGSYFTRHGYLRDVHLNTWGFRDREFKIAKPARVFRIVVIGDSFTFGQGIKAEERYSNLLASRLNQGKDRYEVMNLGRCGAETVDELDILRKTALKIEPDFILLQWFVNDVEGHDKSGRPQYLSLLPSDFLGARLKRSSALYYIVNNQWISLQYRLGLTPSYVDYMRKRFGDPDSPDSREAAAQLGEFIRTCKTHHIPLAIVLFPSFDYDLGAGYPFEFLHQRVARICRAENIRFLDLRATFARFSDRQRLWANRLDAHPGALANRIAADEIMRRFGRFWIKRLSTNNTFELAPVFWPPLAAPQWRNPQRSAATPAVARNRHDQIRLKIRRESQKSLSVDNL